MTKLPTIRFSWWRRVSVLACVAAILSSAQTSKAQQQNTAAGAGQPAQAIAGQWSADVRMSSSIASGRYEQHWWVGRSWGRIEPSGRMSFATESGCVFHGLLLSPAFNQYSGHVQATRCNSRQFDRRYQASVSSINNGANIRVRLTTVDFVKGGTDSFEVTGDFVRY